MGKKDAELRREEEETISDGVLQLAAKTLVWSFIQQPSLEAVMLAKNST